MTDRRASERETTAPETTAPETTAPETAEPETTAPETAEPEAEPVDVCATVTAAQVEAVIGAGAGGAEPLTLAEAGDACVWRSASGADVLAAAVVDPAVLPTSGETADIFALFALDPAAYAQTSVSTSSGGAASVVVAVGFVEPGRDTSDALRAIADALQR